MRVTAILLLAILVVACVRNAPNNQSGAGHTPSASPTQSASAVQPSSNFNEALSHAEQISMPVIRSAVRTILWRKSDTKDKAGDYHPPWKRAEIKTQFDKQPEVGDEVTVIPLETGIAPIRLKIIGATRQKNPCDDNLPPTWEVELEPITKKEFLEAGAITGRIEETPFDVCVIYPAVEFARALNRSQISGGMIPQDVSLNTIFAAIDLTNDQAPDVTIIEYCCGEPTKPAKDCEYTCGKTYKKANDTWVQIDSSQPC